MNMRRRLVPIKRFKQDMKCLKKRCLPLDELYKIIEKLLNAEQLNMRHKDHALTCNYKGFRECHVRSDWLLIYAICEEKLILTASRTGTHFDLFNE